RRFTLHRQWLGQRGYDSTLAYLRDMCALVLERTGLLPHANPGAMDEESMAALREVNVSLGMMVESLSPRLFKRGGAHRGCPDKLPRPRLATLEAAGRLQVPFTTGILIGIGESPEERVDALLAIKEINGRYGHIQEVIIQNFRAKPDIAMRDWPQPNEREMLRTIAVARLLFGPEINLQAPPNLSPEGYPLYLHGGINDWGGVSPVTLDCINPEMAWPALGQLRANTEAAGFNLRERLAIYPEFALQPDRFLSATLHQPVQRWVDETGLVRSNMERW
ncbi:MAG: 7,8-didemethyl-8-hydroxy-5-deazariboflavin synthase CofG, partial [Chloroflexi bacterium]|nr:7,8-didemethyl-8-hydroxy-5-deazariboflavin synthase CofG [Chloroflexota bacterium]